MATTTLIETITLPNGLILEILDQSRPIAADTIQVAFLARINVALEESLFSCREHFEATRRIFGPQITYVYRKERTFVPSGEKDAVFRDLLDTFKRDTLAYLSHKDFSRRFALSKHRDIQTNPYKYGPRPDGSIDGQEC